MNKNIQIFVVEDSSVQCELLVHVLSSEPNFTIIGTAHNGKDAIAQLEHLTPSVVIMDLHMPMMNGIEAITKIMSTKPLPIIATSASNGLEDKINSFYALQAGAVAFVEKPVNINHPQYDTLRADLIQTVRLMSEVKVIRRWKKNSANNALLQPSAIGYTIPRTDIELIAIGVSTGGPIVLQSILSRLSKDFPPILIVQHIAQGFIQELANWLSTTTKCQVEVAKNNQNMLRGHVYLAPDHCQMGISKYGTILLQPDKKEKLCPSVSYLFSSINKIMKNKVIGIVLTGMGSDGAQELKLMKDQGAITIAQSKETSLIHGMPGHAIQLNAATYVMSPDEIASLIDSLKIKD